MSECVLCEPAPHPNCETYTQIVVEDPETRKDATIDVCLEHFEVIYEQTQQER